ncbi:MAG TPA: flagellin [Bryobacteraceae bacterium]|nr:flagellin [Bryobacteraceae bacterium]
MSLSIQTNVTSLVAQENLRVNTAFQSKTIQQLTSGYRINQSGDDAAGLAVANKFRSATAELTQGVANANDGTAQLQIMDGGMSNISQMLDRLKTLATQSASGTFTGDRTVLNAEFQSDISEINRQAQSIGLNTGGLFAQNLAVYIGQGSGSTGTANGVVNVDLSKATVDTQSLGLQGVQAGQSVTGYNLAGSSATSVQNIVAANQGALTNGNTSFTFNGPGFGDSNGIKISVNMNGVGDTTSLVNAINAGIAAAASQPTSAAAAFKSAGITASIAVSSSGVQTLAFNSSNAAFQVKANDAMSNALMGNLNTSTAVGNNPSYTVTAGAGKAGAATASQVFAMQISGGGLTSPQTVTYTATVGQTGSQVAAGLQAAIAGNTALKNAGISMTGANATTGVVLTSSTGEAFTATVAGDKANILGFGSNQLGTGNAAQYSDITAAAVPGLVDAATATLTFTFAGGSQAAINVAADTGQTVAQLAVAINNKIAGDNTLSKTDIQAIGTGPNLEIKSNLGTLFSLNVTSTAAGADLGFDGGAALTTANGVTNAAGATGANGAYATLISGGAYELATTSAGVNSEADVAFTPLPYASDSQAFTITANDASGGQHSRTITLANTAANSSGTSTDAAIHAINTALQQSNDATLQQITAVKGSSGINFISTLQTFSVAIGPSADAGGTGGFVGATTKALQVGTGSSVDISNMAGAQNAVTAITAAVAKLGSAQAAVGKGENQLNYSIQLAQSQITNFSSAESQIRDADVAQQAANLSKAQVLQQASIAAMAQANTAPQALLALLKG